MTDIKELIPDPAILITGLRDTGYDFNTSLADIVDNSIDAQATSIDIRIDLKTNGEPIVTVVDNGCGMTREGLIDGMRYGSKEKKDPKRLGKFGLGLKTASTAFCRKLSVISKSKKEDPFFMATWDLDLVARNNRWELQVLEEKDIPQYYLSIINGYTNGNHGTLVVWDKIDRMANGKITKSTTKGYSDKFSNYATMIYHRFIDTNDHRAPNITMRLNGEQLLPFDPFCLNEMRPDETGTLLYSSTEKECEMIMTDGTTHSAKFKLNGYVLPYKDDFSSEEARKNARITNKNMGFWVYRENRLIAAGDWLGLRVSEPHDSLCRIEFSFDHELDAAFKIDIKKSKINLSPDLLEWLDAWSKPIQQHAQKRYRGKENKKISTSTEISHVEADNSIARKERETILSNISINENAPKKPGTAVVNVENSINAGRDPLVMRIIVPEETNPGVTVITQENLEDGVLWMKTLKNSHHAVMINTTHPFYQKVYYPNRDQRNVITSLDYLFWALAETEWSVSSTGKYDEFQDFKINMSRILKKLVEELPDPEV